MSASLLVASLLSAVAAALHGLLGESPHSRDFPFRVRLVFLGCCHMHPTRPFSGVIFVPPGIF